MGIGKRYSRPEGCHRAFEGLRAATVYQPVWNYFSIWTQSCPVDPSVMTGPLYMHCPRRQEVFTCGSWAVQHGCYDWGISLILSSYHLNISSHLRLVASLLDRAVFTAPLAVPAHPGWTSVLFGTILPDTPKLELFLLQHPAYFTGLLNGLAEEPTQIQAPENWILVTARCPETPARVVSL